MSCSITSMSWVNIAEYILIEMFPLSAAFSVQLVRNTAPMKHHQTRTPHLLQHKFWYSFFVHFDLFTCSSTALQQWWPLAEAERCLEMFQLLAEVTRVNTQGALTLLVNTLQLTDGNSLHCWHLIMGFALKQKSVVTGADGSYANIKHTQTPHMRRSEVWNNEGHETLACRDVSWDYCEVWILKRHKYLWWILHRNASTKA